MCAAPVGSRSRARRSSVACWISSRASTMKCWRRSSIAVTPWPLVDDRILEATKIEPFRDPGHGLGMAETDVASRMQGVIEVVDRKEAGGIIEIDQDVSAEDDVEP